ncbi:NAD(P)/FAD-dependent oxidoreductase [Acuticoccus sediminis]|uniref:NAD(P)/FAD-dependent oxidoreductase n=1 Tax=Acuticoccus sediminis TaxID=2184697 RepID=UPI001CFE8CB6|nr:FAD-binding oxidoreductase [Acuticoccus sediminis]
MGTSAASFERSLWFARCEEPRLSAAPLAGDAEVDCCVVGAGFTGLSTALHLAETGREVAVLEAEEVGFGASGRNGGQVIPGLKDDPDQLEAKGGAALVDFAGTAADVVFDLVERHAIRCQPERNGWIQAAHSARALPAVQARARQWAARGVAVEMLSPADIEARIGTGAYHGGWRDPRAGLVQPLAYVRGLARAFVAAGGTLHEKTPVTALRRAGDRWSVSTPAGTVSARTVVVATNAYGSGLVPGLAQSILQVQSMVVATAPLPPALSAGVMASRACLSETRKLAFYMRLSPDDRLVFGGRGAVGPDQKAALGEALVGGMRSLFPAVKDVPVDYVWSGHLALTMDHLPHVHTPEPGLFAAQGYNGRGIAMASATGRALAAHIAHGTPLPLVPIPIAPVAWHAMRRPVMNLGVRWYWARDRLGFPG